MAQLPRYKKDNASYVGMPSLTTAASQQQVGTNERLNRFLGEATKYFQSQAVDYATDQAIEDAIRNPITAEQLAQARQTGDNPIEKYLSGGSAYNDAITKTLGQQVAGELNLELQKYQNEILEQVRLGQIENPEEMLAKLKEPIQAQVEFFSSIDPEIARAYGANASLSAQNKYHQGATIFSDIKEKNAFANAEQTITNNVNDYSNYLLYNPDATVEQKQIYKETQIKVATDTSLSMSRNQLKLKETMIKQLNTIEDEHVAKAIASDYKGDTIDEVLKDLSSKQAKGSNADYFKGKNILNQDQFATRIQNYLAIENAGLAAIRQQVTYDIGNAKQFIQNGQVIDPALIKSIEDNIDKDSVQYQEWQTIEGISDNMDIWNTTDVAVLQNTYEMMDANRANVNVIQSQPEQIAQNALGAYLKNLGTALKNDMVGTILSRSGQSQELDVSDPEALKSQVRQRRESLNKYGPLYGLTKPEYEANIMTKNETTEFLTRYIDGDARTRVQMLANLDEGFGDNASQAMLQLTKEGLPITAELSSFFKNPRMTEQFMSYDMPEEQDRLKAYAKQRDTSYQNIQTEVRSSLEEFEDVIMKNNQFNTGPAIAKLDSMVNALSYHAISIMSTQNKDAEDAAIIAADVINNSFELTKDYFIPTLYNGRGVNVDQVKDKAQTIQDFYVDDFNPVAFKSSVPGVSDQDMNDAMKESIRTDGRWANTADGTGLVYGIVFADGSFAPIQNAQGDLLTFKFDDLTYRVPATDVEITKKPPEFLRTGKYMRDQGGK